MLKMWPKSGSWLKKTAPLGQGAIYVLSPEDLRRAQSSIFGVLNGNWWDNFQREFPLALVWVGVANSQFSAHHIYFLA